MALISPHQLLIVEIDVIIVITPAKVAGWFLLGQPLFEVFSTAWEDSENVSLHRIPRHGKNCALGWRSGVRTDALPFLLLWKKAITYNWTGRWRQMPSIRSLDPFPRNWRWCVFSAWSSPNFCHTTSWVRYRYQHCPSSNWDMHQYSRRRSMTSEIRQSWTRQCVMFICRKFPFWRR